MEPKKNNELDWILLWVVVAVYLWLVVISTVHAGEAPHFDERLCAPLQEIASGLMFLSSEGKTVSVEHVGEGTLRIEVDLVLTVWQLHPGTGLWCMQEHLGGQGA